MQLIDISGQTFGRLTVVEYAGRNRTSAQWLCKCQCGNEVVVIGNKLRNGHTKSCSCAQKEVVGALNRTHGKRFSSEYQSWKAMRERCNYAGSISYSNYGAKGVTVCERWQNSFANFLADMGLKPDKTYTIDRTDNSKGYSPDNCTWATKREQGANTTRNRRIVFNNQEKILADWARHFNVTPTYLYFLEKKMGIEGGLNYLLTRCQ